MKKVLSLVMAVALLLSAFVTGATADTGAKITFSSPTIKSDATTVTITGTLSGDLVVKALGLQSLTYDTTNFEFQSFSWSIPTGAMMEQAYSEDSEGNVTAGVVAYKNETTISGTVFTVVLKVKEGCKANKTSITGAFSAKNGKTIYIDKETGVIEAGEITVTCAAHKYGEWEQTKAPTCIAKGEESRTCSVCGNVEKRDVAVIDHSMSKTNAKKATCTEAGNNEYWYCSDCKKYYKDEAGTTETTVEKETLSALGHDLQHHEFNDSTCIATGNYEYWYCKRCQKSFTTEDCTAEMGETVIGKKPHSMTKTPANEATCLAAGNNEYYYCSTCQKYYKDENGVTETTVEAETIAKKAHSMTKTNAKAATCTEAGNNEYWYCSTCQKYYKEEAGTTETTVENETLSALGHDKEHHEYKDSTCTATGNYEYWYCKRCQKSFTTEDCTTEMGETVIGKKAHSMTKTPANEATCLAAGNNEYWYCSTCQKYYKDENGVTETTVEAETIAKKAHSMTKTNAKAATCTEAGNNEYWYCSTCQKYYKEEAGTTETTVENETLSALGHDLQHHEFNDSTCIATGNYEYWYCTRCQKSFTTEACTTEIGETVIGKKPHAMSKTPAKAASCTEDGNNEYYYCSSCKKYYKDINGVTETTVEAETIKGGHKMQAISAKAPTCTEKGNNAYFYCTVCEKYFKDVNGTTQTTVEAEELAKIPHNIVFVPAKKADCLSEGYPAHYKCTACGEIYEDMEGSVIIPNLTKSPKLPHQMTKISGKAATDTAEGNNEYYYCEECNKYYKDAEGTVETTVAAETIQKLKSDKETKKTDNSGSPVTGEGTAAAVAVTLFAAAAATVILTKKKR